MCDRVAAAGPVPGIRNSRREATSVGTQASARVTYVGLLALAIGLISPSRSAARRVEATPSAPAEGGARLCVSGHKVNLRAGPSTRAAVHDRLGLGTTVMVRAIVPGGPVRIGSRTDWWYQVAVLDDTGVATLKGYLFGGTLTPACVLADLDADGEAERATVAINTQGTPLVRILEPTAEAEVTASLPITRAGTEPLTVATVDLIPASEAGFAMVRVVVSGSTEAAAAEGRVFYVSYQSPRAGRVGSATLAFSHPASGHRGTTSWQTDVRFSGATREAWVTTQTTVDGGSPTESVRYFKSADGSFVDVTDRR